jgi:hypothetical protein
MDNKTIHRILSLHSTWFFSNSDSTYRKIKWTSRDRENVTLWSSNNIETFPLGCICTWFLLLRYMGIHTNWRAAHGLTALGVLLKKWREILVSWPNYITTGSRWNILIQDWWQCRVCSLDPHDLGSSPEWNRFQIRPRKELESENRMNKWTCTYSWNSVLGSNHFTFSSTEVACNLLHFRTKLT